MRFIDANVEKVLHIGKQGENGVTKVSFEAFLAQCKAEFGAGTVALAHQRAEDEAPYLATVTGGMWTVASSDVQYAGTGLLELTYTVGSQVKKSMRWKTCTLSALGNTVTPPAAWQSYVDTIVSKCNAALLKMEQLEGELEEEVTQELTVTITDTGKCVRSDGGVATNAGSACTNFIEVQPGKRISVSGARIGTNFYAYVYEKPYYMAGTFMQDVSRDEDGNPYTSGEFSFIVPEGAHYFRTTVAADASAADISVIETLRVSKINDKQDKLTAGTGIALNDTTISVQNYSAIAGSVADVAQIKSELITETTTALTVTIAETGKCIRADGGTATNAGSAYTAFIPVTEGALVSVTGARIGTNFYAYLYESALYSAAMLKKDVSRDASGQPYSSGSFSFTVPSGYHYFRTTVAADATGADVTVTEKVTFHAVADVAAKLKDSIFTGKKWAAVGDSFTAYTNKNLSDGRCATYPRLIAERTGIKVLDDFCLGGRTMAYPADGSFVNSFTAPSCAGYYQNLPADVDYITIMLGINDKGHSTGHSDDGESTTGAITLGTIDDTGTATYYGAYNTVLGWIRENRPYAHVGIIVTNGLENFDWMNAQIQLARKWGIPFINLNGDDETPAMLRCTNPFMPAALKTKLKQLYAVDYDGSATGTVNLHPNWKSHEFESRFIEAFLHRI